jgi:mono/diheme cytochrome c family protein
MLMKLPVQVLESRLATTAPHRFGAHRIIGARPHALAHRSLAAAALFGGAVGPSVCHGESAVGGGVVPDLRASTFIGNDFFYEIMLNGAMKAADIAPFLSRDDVTAIRAYLIQRANEDKTPASRSAERAQ